MERVEVLPRFDSDPVPLTRDTLIIMLVNQKSAGYTDSAGAEVPTFDVVGSGDLYVLHQGEVVAGRWFRANQDSGYQFVGEDGNLLRIPAENLYVGVFPNDSGLDFGN